MFKEIAIRLTGPICRCEKKDLAWELPNSDSLRLKCRKCGVQLFIPNKEFTATFELEKLYPDDERKKIQEVLEKDPQFKDILKNEPK